MPRDPAIKPWAKLYVKYARRKYSSSENDRKFTSFAGVLPQVAETLFQKYSTIGRSSPLYSRLDLLIVLYFLKHAPTEDRGTQVFCFGSRNTYRKKLWAALHYLDIEMDEISLEDRYHPFVPSRGPFKDVCVIADATECPIDR